ncbi:MAG TPA: hypothetical protein VGR15_07280 [Bacteroidota bacterium]|jgi:hypothetical protein|nr:hypothetical protein [Bacteroidota bacterium]
MDAKPDKFIPALYGGIIMGLVWSTPVVQLLNCLCCAGIMLGGFLAVFFYKKNFTPDTPSYTSGDCMIVGFIAGNIGAVVASLLELLMKLIFGAVPPEEIIAWLRRMHFPEESMQFVEQVLMMLTGVFGFFLKLIASLFIGGIFGLVGGLIAYSIFKPKATQLVPPQHTPPPPAA